MTAALGIKPGKYRTRDGHIVTIENKDRYGEWAGRLADQVLHWHAKGNYYNFGEHERDLIERIEDQPQGGMMSAPSGIVSFGGLTGSLSKFNGSHTLKEQTCEFGCFTSWTGDRVTRSDCPQHGAQTGTPVTGGFTTRSFQAKASSFPDNDFHVSYGARDAIRANDGDLYERQLSTAVMWCAARNLKLVAMHEWDGPPICSDREAMFNERIARLEAENESISRQLRSREVNKEPVSTGKRFRWSPMV
jgi:hypothetical protein